jgi:ABC-type transport system involved in cytochrome c biogenesis permease subunit
MSITRPSLSALAAIMVALAAASVLMTFFIAPEDADQGLSQKIFYVHVPIALTATSRATRASTRGRSSVR